MSTEHKRVVVAMGTRPEVIKLAPVVRALEAVGIEAPVLATAQHREMLDQMLAHFGLTPAMDLDLMQPGQTLPELTARILNKATPALQQLKPDLVVVQGDTTTTFITALAAFYERIPVVHVEAGLRSGDLSAPYPEEMNRRMTSVITRRHYAPTERSRDALVAEGYDAADIRVVGNTVIDALLAELAADRPAPECLDDPPAPGSMILVTQHRRENFGGGLESVGRALRRILESFPDAWILFPIHPNPAVRAELGALVDHPRIRLVDPLGYPDFCKVLAAADLAISDSGGVQEEAPSAGTPVVVTRTVTERPEGVDAGVSVLVGTDEEKIVAAATERLEAVAGAEALPDNPYGDGQAAARIAADISELLQGGP